MNHGNGRRMFFAAFCIVILGTFVTIRAFAQTDAKPLPSAKDLVSEAVKTAKAEDKAVFIHFKASWCIWCKRLETFLEDPQMGKMLKDHYVLVGLDVMERGEKTVLENPGANAFLDSLGGANAGLPFCVFLDKDGKKIADSRIMPENQNVGYPGVAEEISAFAALLKRTAPGLGPEEEANIFNWLTKNAPGAQGAH
jgi:thiol:disulfide interchange protein